MSSRANHEAPARALHQAQPHTNAPPVSIFHAPIGAEDGAYYPEPDWMPAAEEIDRARADLERRGVVRSLQRSRTPGQMVTPGEVPCPWLAGAALWVIVWPAVIALKAGSELLPWLPWWLSISVAMLHLAGLFVPVLVAQREAGQDAVRRRFGKVQTLAQMLALEPDEFEVWVGMLFTLAGYRVQNTKFAGDHGIDLAVSSGSVPRGLVQCKRYRGTVGEPVIRELYGTHVHENADCSWLATTGAISRKARDWAAGKPLELWDGQKLTELARQYR